jgi:methyl coenzyme M reductase alpha subunit
MIMPSKTLKIEITVESDDLHYSTELCSNEIVSDINRIIRVVTRRYNNGTKRAVITSKIEST